MRHLPIKIGLKAPASAPAVAHGATVPTHAARDVIHYASEHGAQPADLLAAAGIEPAALNNPDGRLSGEAMGALWEAAALQTGDPDFGLHLGSYARPYSLSIIGYAMLNASTLGDAFGALVRYFALFTEGAAPRLDLGGPHRHAAIEFAVTMSTANYLFSAPRQPMECTLAMLVRVTEVLTGQRLPVRVVAFAHEAPPTGTATHEAVFGVVPRFGAPQYRLAFEPGALRWHIATESPRLHDVFEQEAEQILGELDESTCARVTEAVARRLHGSVPTLAEIATDLTVGERTLQRQLDTEGTSFREIVDAARCALAQRYLARPHATIHEVAFLLGFSEPSAFHHAFKRWTGITPRVWREGRRTELLCPRPVAFDQHSDVQSQ